MISINDSLILIEYGLIDDIIAVIDISNQSEPSFLLSENII